MVNNCAFGYLSQRIVFYLLNLHIKSRHTYFARAGTTIAADSYKADASLSEEGEDYTRKMSETLLAHREQERKAIIDQGGPENGLKPLTVWTSTRRRTVETSGHLAALGYRVRQRSQMSQLNPGVCEKMTETQIRRDFPEEVSKHEADPYHHRYPRAEVCSVAPIFSTACVLANVVSRITILLFAWSRLFLSSKESRMIFSSSHTRAFFASCTDTSWHAMPKIFPG